MLAYIQNIIRYGFVTNTSKDESQFPVQQVKIDGALNDVAALSPYGIHANIATDTLVATASIEGDPSNVIIIGAHTPNRPKLATGENCIYHPPTGTKIHFKADGTITIDTGGENTTMNITGDLNVSGDINAANVTATTEVTAGSVTLTGHTHPAVGSIVTTATVGSGATPGVLSGNTGAGVG